MVKAYMDGVRCPREADESLKQKQHRVVICRRMVGPLCYLGNQRGSHSCTADGVSQNGVRGSATSGESSMKTLGCIIPIYRRLLIFWCEAMSIVFPKCLVRVSYTPYNAVINIYPSYKYNVLKMFHTNMYFAIKK